MRLLFLSAVLGCSFTANALGDPFLRLHLNQRNYINPGSVCPFCSGSSFATFGFRNQQGIIGDPFRATYFSVGDDSRNALHGPWDFGYARMREGDFTVDAYSARYAFAFEIGGWRTGIGARVNYMNVVRVPESDANPMHPVMNFTKQNQFDWDAGLMVTNLHGTYFGASLRHIGSKTLSVGTYEGVPAVPGIPFILNQQAAFVAGTKIDLDSHWDLLPEATFIHNGETGVFDGGAMIRFNHRWALGASYATGDRTPAVAIRGGFTHQQFKWLATVEPSGAGLAVETGIVWRFNFDGECNGVPPKPIFKKKREFYPHE